MASFAEINDEGLVLRVLVVDDKDTTDVDGNTVESAGVKYLSDAFGGTWKQTSADTRKRKAGKGMTYDDGRDAFIYPQPFDSWVLDEVTAEWVSPIPKPDDDSKTYRWDEQNQEWVGEDLPDWMTRVDAQ